MVKTLKEIFKKTHIKAMKWKKFFNSISGCIVKFGVEVSMQFKVLNEALKLYMKHKFIIWKHLRSFITSSTKIWMPFQIEVIKWKNKVKCCLGAKSLLCTMIFSSSSGNLFSFLQNLIWFWPAWLDKISGLDMIRNVMIVKNF